DGFSPSDDGGSDRWSQDHKARSSFNSGEAAVQTRAELSAFRPKVRLAILHEFLPRTGFCRARSRSAMLMRVYRRGWSGILVFRCTSLFLPVRSPDRVTSEKSISGETT